MPIPRIVLTTSQRDDLAITCAVGASALERIARKIAAQSRTIRRSAIDAIIKGEVGDNDGTVVSRFLFSIAGPLRREIATADEILSGITAAIDRSLKDDARFSTWTECRPVLSTLLSSNSIMLAAKALDISYDFERVYTGGRFLTSVRPVYTVDHDDIVGATIVHTFRLDFTSANGEEASISIAIDLEDIRRLHEACKDAIDKAALAKSKFEGKYDGLETITPGGGLS